MHRHTRERTTAHRTALRRLARLAAFALSSAVAATALIGIGAAQTSSVQASERTIKAAFLYKFAEYVDWPAAPVRPVWHAARRVRRRAGRIPPGEPRGESAGRVGPPVARHPFGEPEHECR